MFKATSWKSKSSTNRPVFTCLILVAMPTRGCHWFGPISQCQPSKNICRALPGCGCMAMINPHNRVVSSQNMTILVVWTESRTRVWVKTPGTLCSARKCWFYVALTHSHSWIYTVWTIPKFVSECFKFQAPSHCQATCYWLGRWSSTLTWIHLIVITNVRNSYW